MLNRLSEEVLVLSSDDEDKAPPASHQNHFNHSTFSGGSAEVIDISSGDEDSVPSYSTSSSFCPTINLDYNLLGAHDDDDCHILDNQPNIASNDDNNYEDFNNCGSHTDDSLNTPDGQGRVLVNVAHPLEDPDIYLAPQIARIVKPHQIGGIRFMYDNIIESMERFKNSSGLGCILSHSMGLGKTLQVFIDCHQYRKDGFRHVDLTVSSKA